MKKNSFVAWRDWATKPPNPGWRAAVSVGVMLLLAGVLWQSSTAMVVRWSEADYESAVVALKHSEAQWEQLDARQKGEQQWFVADLTQDSVETLARVKQQLTSQDSWQDAETGDQHVSAETALLMADSASPFERSFWARQSLSSSRDVDEMMRVVAQRMDQHVADRRDAKARLAELDAQMAKISHEHGQLDTLQYDVQQYTLPKYTDPISQTLRQAYVLMVDLSNWTNQGRVLLPDDEYLVQAGDPIQAQVWFDKVAAGIDGPRPLLKQGTDELNNLLFYHKGYKAQVLSARQEVPKAWTQLESIRTTRQWSYELGLALPHTYYLSATIELSATAVVGDFSTALTTIVDYPAIYDHAVDARHWAALAENEANRLVGVADNVAEMIVAFPGGKVLSAQQVPTIHQNLLSLNRYHDRSTWLIWATAESRANEALKQADTAYQQAKSQSSLAFQQFDAASVSMGNAYGQLEAVKTLANQVSTTLSELESYRLQYTPDMIGQAETEIGNSAWAYTNLSGYSTSGAGQYRSAQSTLREAKTTRDSKKWKEAYTLADTARELAITARQTIQANATATELSIRATETQVAANATATRQAQIRAATATEQAKVEMTESAIRAATATVEAAHARATANARATDDAAASATRMAENAASNHADNGPSSGGDVNSLGGHSGDTNSLDGGFGDSNALDN